MPIAANIPVVIRPDPKEEVFDIWYITDFHNNTNPFGGSSVLTAEFAFGRLENYTKEDGTTGKKFIAYKDKDNNFVRANLMVNDFFSFIKEKALSGDPSFKALMDLTIEKLGQIAKEKNILVVPS